MNKKFARNTSITNKNTNKLLKYFCFTDEPLSLQPWRPNFFCLFCSDIKMTSYFKKYMEDTDFKKVKFQLYFVLFIAVRYITKMKNQYLFAQANFISFQKWLE